jgi:hypothetical protein
VNSTSEFCFHRQNYIRILTLHLKEHCDICDIHNESHSEYFPIRNNSLFSNYVVGSNFVVVISVLCMRRSTEIEWEAVECETHRS